jgi:hypothetical protein
MQRFFEENYRKNLSLKFIHINNVTHLYPNPATDVIQLHVNSLSNINEGIVEIVSSTGKIVQQEKKTFIGDIQQDISDLPKGIYLLRIRANDKSLSKKFIKL